MARKAAAKRAHRKGSAQAGRTANPIDITDPANSSIFGDEGVTWGSVDSYAVDDDRLMIKLTTSAIGRSLISLGTDEPHFRSGVSMTMMAYHTPGTKLTVRYVEPNRPNLSGPTVLKALEIGIGSDPGETLNFDDWEPLA